LLLAVKAWCRVIESSRIRRAGPTRKGGARRLPALPWTGAGHRRRPLSAVMQPDVAPGVSRLAPKDCNFRIDEGHVRRCRERNLAVNLS
jgi:hypothetical protein